MAVAPPCRSYSPTVILAHAIVIPADPVVIPAHPNRHSCEGRNPEVRGRGHSRKNSVFHPHHPQPPYRRRPVSRGGATSRTSRSRAVDFKHAARFTPSSSSAVPTRASFPRPQPSLHSPPPRHSCPPRRHSCPPRRHSCEGRNPEVRGRGHPRKYSVYHPHHPQPPYRRRPVSRGGAPSRTCHSRTVDL